MLRGITGLLKGEQGKVIEYGLLIALFVVLGAGIWFGLYVQSTGVMESVPQIFYDILAEANAH